MTNTWRCACDGHRTAVGDKAFAQTTDQLSWAFWGGGGVTFERASQPQYGPCNADEEAILTNASAARAADECLSMLYFDSAWCTGRSLWASSS